MYIIKRDTEIDGCCDSVSATVCIECESYTELLKTVIPGDVVYVGIEYNNESFVADKAKCQALKDEKAKNLMRLAQFAFKESLAVFESAEAAKDVYQKAIRNVNSDISDLGQQKNVLKNEVKKRPGLAATYRPIIDKFDRDQKALLDTKVYYSNNDEYPLLMNRYMELRAQENKAYEKNLSEIEAGFDLAVENVCRH